MIVSINPLKVSKVLRSYKSSTRKIAAKAGVSQTTVVSAMHSKETGHCPSMFTVVKFARGLGVSKDVFLGN